MSEIAPSYLDVWQREHKLDPHTRRALEKALGPRLAARKIRVEKGACCQPERMAQGGRLWGVMVQLYGIRSERNWGIGDFTDLAMLLRHAADAGARFVGISPVHALFPADPTLYSQYSASSRHARAR